MTVLPLAQSPSSDGSRQRADAGTPSSHEFLTLVGLAGLTVALMFLLWEGIQRGFGHTDALIHQLHAARGVSTSLVAAIVVAWTVYRQQLRRRAFLESQIEGQLGEAQLARTTFEAVCEHAPAGLWILDQDYRVLFVNSEARRIHGHDVVIGERYPCDVARRGSDAVCKSCPAKHTVLTCEPAKKKGYRTEPVTGEVIAVETYPISFREGHHHVLVVERVVTEQQKLNASLLHQEKMAAFGLLSAGVAHDMGNPLSGIEMHLQLLQEESLPDDARDSVDTARREVARLRRTLRDLVDFARRRRADASLVSVNEVVDNALRLLRYDQRMRQIETRIEADPDTPPVHLVEDHLMQIALNLMLNALDAMPEGGTLRIEIKPTSDGVALRIHDTGVGMSREVLDQCCDPLYSTKPVGRGTGLGLSMCKDILHASGGELELHSAPKQGTTVVVTLPAAADELEGAADSAETSERLAV